MSDSTIQRIVIVNVWHDDNKGDGGIAEGVLTLVQSHYPQAQLGIVSMFPESAPAYKSAHRHLKARFPGIEVQPSPFVSHDPSKSGGLARLLKKIWQVPVSLFQLNFPQIFRNPGARLIAQADLVVANGGQYLYTQKENYLNSLFTVYRLLYPLLLARQCQVPYVMFSQSFGFHCADRLDNALVRSTLNHAVSNWAREKLSYQQLLDVGVVADRLALVPDAAFVLAPQKSDRVQALLDQHGLSAQNFWVITVRQWSSFTTAFLNEVEKFVNAALQTGLTEKIVLMAHTHGPSEGGDDRLPTRELAQRFTEQQAVIMMEDDLIPSELVAFYGEAELMVGTRFHSVIFSLVGGTPAYAVSYAGPKTWGIMKMLEMDQLCSDMSDFSADMALERIKSTDLRQHRGEIPEKINRLQQVLNEQFENLDIPTLAP